MNQIKNIIHRAKLKPNGKLNILTWSTHERVQSWLDKTGHKFYCYHGNGAKVWNTKYAPVPPNHIMLDGNKQHEQLPLDVPFDCVLSQSRHVHFPLAKQTSQALQIPIVTYEHCIPPPTPNPQAYLAPLMDRVGAINVYITDYSIGAWGFKPGPEHVSIYHAIETDRFCPPPDHVKITDVLTVMNDCLGRPGEMGTPFWMEVQQGMSGRIKLVGDNGHLGKSAESVDALVKEYQLAKVFFNSTFTSTVPTSMLEAMSCGCAVVARPTGAIPEVIKHGENGFLVNTPQEAILAINSLLQNPTLQVQFGQKARETVIHKFQLDRYINQWNEVFENIRRMVYTP